MVDIYHINWWVFSRISASHQQYSTSFEDFEKGDFQAEESQQAFHLCESFWQIPSAPESANKTTHEFTNQMNRVRSFYKSAQQCLKV